MPTPNYLDPSTFSLFAEWLPRAGGPDGRGHRLQSETSSSKVRAGEGEVVGTLVSASVVAAVCQTVKLIFL